MARFYIPSGGGGGDTDILQFTTGNANDPAVAQITWDDDFETLQIGLDAAVDLQIGQEHLVRVKNASGVTAIAKGKAVMFAGAAGDTVTVAPAVSDGSVDHSYFVGITAEEIPADGFGFVTQFGYVNQIKTDYAGWSAGTLLYIDAANPGDLTHTEPTAPAWHSPIAAVTVASAEAGRMLVRALPSEALKHLDDVELSSPANGETLVYNGSTGVWENQAPAAGGDTLHPFFGA